MSEEGLEAMSRFADEGIKTNCTLIFTANQGLLAAKAGASLLSPFVGRLDDINQDGMIVIRELAEIVAIHELDTEVLAASIRNPLHMTQAALAGAHVATLPFKVLKQMVHHPLTDSGIVQFRSDWEKAREALAARDGGQKQEVAATRQQARRVTDGPWQRQRRSSASSWATRPSRSPGTRTSRRTSSGSTTTCTSRTRSARCSSTSAAGGSRCDHMFRRFGTPFAVDWLAKNVNGYVYTTAIPADPDVRIEGTEYSSRYGARVPRDATYATTMGAYLDTVLPVYGAHFADWWRDRLVPEMQRNFDYLEERLDAADGMSLAETATLLEDAIDIHDRHWKIHWMLNFAQLSATLDLRAVMEKLRGAVDEELLGRLQNSASDRNWDSIEALWRMKNEVRDDPELRAAFAADGGPRHRAATSASTERGRRFIAERVEPVPARVRLARRLEPRVHLSDGPRADGAGHRARPRLPRDRLRLPDRHRRDARATSRRPRARSSRA